MPLESHHSDFCGKKVIAIYVDCAW